MFEFFFIFGKENITTGAEGDIKHATNILIKMIKHYGMFSEIGMLNYDLLEGTSDKIYKVSSETILDLYNEVIDLLLDNKILLDKIASTLLKKEFLEEEEINNIIVKQY